jgi:hypothetical protein
MNELDYTAVLSNIFHSSAALLKDVYANHNVHESDTVLMLIYVAFFAMCYYQMKRAGTKYCLVLLVTKLFNCIMLPCSC